MRYLFQHWSELSRRRSTSARSLFLFDFDGVLAPIAPTPAEAQLKHSVRAILALLAKQKRTHVGVLSGRALSDVYSRVRLPHLYYGGNHGLEMKGPHWRWLYPIQAFWLKQIPRLAASLRRHLRGISGVIVENKERTISVHYRRVSPGNRSLFRRRWQAAVANPALLEGGHIRRGKAVIEFRPLVQWNKGTALAYLKKRLKADLVVYVGDDYTDEDAFHVLSRKDLGVRVGRTRASCAPYYLRSPQEVKRMMERLVLEGTQS